MKTVYPEADSLTSSERSEADTEITTGEQDLQMFEKYQDPGSNLENHKFCYDVDDDDSDNDSRLRFRFFAWT